MASAGIQLKVNPFGFEGAERTLNRIVGRVGNLRPVMNIAGQYLVRRTQDSFRRQASPEGIPWAPLSPVTIALRDAAGSRSKQLGRARARYAERNSGSVFSGDKALFVTGRLFASITYSAGDMEVSIGTNAKFPGGDSRAAIHQLGGKAGRGHAVTIPARPFLGVTEQDTTYIGEKAQDYLESA